MLGSVLGHVLLQHKVHRTQTLSTHPPACSASGARRHAGSFGCITGSTGLELSAFSSFFIGQGGKSLGFRVEALSGHPSARFAPGAHRHAGSEQHARPRSIRKLEQLQAGTGLQQAPGHIVLAQLLQAGHPPAWPLQGFCRGSVGQLCWVRLHMDQLRMCCVRGG